MQEAAGQVAALEERYWHAFNDLSLQLGTHLQERDATLAKVWCSSMESEEAAKCHYKRHQTSLSSLMHRHTVNS